MHDIPRGVEELYLLTQSAQPYFSKLGFQIISRAHVPAQIQATKEFRTLCPGTAHCMVRRIADEVQYFPSDVLQLRLDIPGAKMWAVTLNRTQLSYFEVEANSRFEKHAHESEQITMVLEGALYFELSDRQVCVAKGEVIAIPSNLPHAVFTKQQPAKAIDAWSPVMEKYRA